MCFFCSNQLTQKAAFEFNARSVKQKQPMKKTPLRILIVCTAALLLASCALVTENLATPERIAKMPEPFKSMVIQLRNEQKAVEARFTQGTKTMIKAYLTIAEAVGMKTEAAVLKAQYDKLKAGSSMSDARKAMSQSKAAINAVRDKLSKSKGVKVASASKFSQGVQIKNQAYMVQLTLATDASIKAANAVQKFKGAGPLEMAILTSQLDPLFFIVRDVPKFLAQERAFNEICITYAKEQKISLPPMDLPAPKLQASY
jgi:hypothetical protein